MSNVAADLIRIRDIRHRMDVLCDQLESILVAYPSVQRKSQSDIIKKIGSALFSRSVWSVEKAIREIEEDYYLKGGRDETMAEGGRPQTGWF